MSIPRPRLVALFFALVSVSGCGWFSSDGGGDHKPHNAPPTASFAANPSSGVAPLVVAFDGSASFDPDGTIVSFAWDFGDGATETGETAEHTYGAAGT
ncbi:MAG: PKD domain-containing protein, partial [Candidatus Dadabacteria bacterium]